MTLVVLKISNEPLKKHRALHLQHLNTNLSGRYSCRVSSIYTEDFKSNDLIIYTKPRSTALNIGWVGRSTLNVTCLAKQVYPEPEVSVYFIADERHDISSQSFRQVVWSGGVFTISVSKIIEFDRNETSQNLVLAMRLLDGDETHVPASRYTPVHFGPLDSDCLTSPTSPDQSSDECPMIRCEFSLPKTPYREIRQKRIPKLPEAFIYDRAATSGSSSFPVDSFLAITQFFMFIILMQK